MLNAGQVISVAFRNWLIRNVDLVKATFECKFRVFPVTLMKNEHLLRCFARGVTGIRVAYSRNG